MVTILYLIEREFMRKTFRSVDRHVDADSAYLPINSEARGCCETIPEIPVDDPVAIDENVRAIDPAVVVHNSRKGATAASFHEEYPLVHIRHGASIGRGEPEKTNEVLNAVDLALAPGERWAERYEDAPVEIVGIPEADKLVESDAPNERRVLYAPTNHNYGGGSYLQTAEDIVDRFANTGYELRFRPHPMDRIEEPGKSLTERCRERIAEVPNITFDETATPLESMRRADMLISDYSGIVAEWLHTGRPLVQLTDIVADNEVPEIGYTTDDLDLETVDRLYRDGYPESVQSRLETFRDALGIPMDGRAGERAAAEVMACTP